MPTKLSQQEAEAVSTFADAAYLWSTLLGETDDPVTGAWVDPITVDVQQLLELSKDTKPVQYTRGTKITTLSYQMYGTTSLWAVLLYLNGYQHPDEIPAGAVLNIPSKASLNRVLIEAREASSNYGKTFTI